MAIQYKKKGGGLISCLANLSFAYAEPQTFCVSEQGTCECESCEKRIIGDAEGLCKSEISIVGDEIKVDCIEPTSPC
jgi:hypothetical protein